MQHSHGGVGGVGGESHREYTLRVAYLRALVGWSLFDATIGMFIRLKSICNLSFTK